MRYKNSILALTLLVLPSVAFAQTSPPPAEATPPPAMPADPTAPAAPADTAAPAEPAAAPAEKPAIATPDQVNPNAPVKGANSFTEGQAKERIEAAGYTDVGALTLDGDGIWNAPAKKGGADLTVQMDYQGNIVSK